MTLIISALHTSGSHANALSHGGPELVLLQRPVLQLTEIQTERKESEHVACGFTGKLSDKQTCLKAATSHSCW